jgi:hypothetical protein
MAGFVLLSWSFLYSNMHTDPLLADLFYDHRYSHTRMTNPDFVLLAKAMGVHAIRVSSASELPEKMKEFLEYDGNKPVLLECVVEANEHVFPMVCPPRLISSLDTDPSLFHRFQQARRSMNRSCTLRLGTVKTRQRLDELGTSFICLRFHAFLNVYNVQRVVSYSRRSWSISVDFFRCSFILCGSHLVAGFVHLRYAKKPGSR